MHPASNGPFHPFDFAQKLAEIAPAGLDRIFFTNSGSEAVDTALKIALACQRAVGQPTHTRLIGRERASALADVGQRIVNNHRAFATHLPGVDHIRHTHDLSRNAFSKELPQYGAEFAEEVEQLVALHGDATIAAVIVEPDRPAGAAEGLSAAAARFLYQARHSAHLRRGHHRLRSSRHAIRGFGVTPDIMTTAKGITNGVIPKGAVFASRKVHDALMTGTESQIELFPGYTYSAHPVASAAGLATRDVIRASLMTRGATLAAHWQHTIHDLRDLPHVVDIRTIGACCRHRIVAAA